MNEFRRKRVFLFSFVCLCFLFCFVCFWAPRFILHQEWDRMCKYVWNRAADAGSSPLLWLQHSVSGAPRHLAGLLHAEWETQVLLHSINTRYWLQHIYVFPSLSAHFKLSSLLDLVHKCKLAYIWNPLCRLLNAQEPESHHFCRQTEARSEDSPWSRGSPSYCHFTPQKC